MHGMRLGLELHFMMIHNFTRYNTQIYIEFKYIYIYIYLSVLFQQLNLYTTL